MPEWEQTFLEPLKERGYFVGAFRKVHQGEDFNRRWDFYGDHSVPFEKFFDDLPSSRPFFLHVGFTDPHRPYRPGAFDPPHDPKLVPVPRFLPDAAEVRQDLAHYYDAIARMDAECGRLFDILIRRGLADRTLVLFTGDNGMPFPRAKGTCYDPGIHVPLVVRWPGRIAPGSEYPGLISHVDLAPTLLATAGLAAPKKMQGRSFLAQLLGSREAVRSHVFSERNWHDNFDPIRSVRTGRYKLIFNAARRVEAGTYAILRAQPADAGALRPGERPRRVQQSRGQPRLRPDPGGHEAKTERVDARDIRLSAPGHSRPWWTARHGMAGVVVAPFSGP
jgi:arylsulfatase A-like enzyme